MHFKAGFINKGEIISKKLLHKDKSTIPHGYALIKQSFVSLGQDDLNVDHGLFGFEGSGIVEYVSGKSTRGIKQGSRVCYSLKRAVGSAQYVILHEKNLIFVLDDIPLNLASFARRLLTAHYLLHKMLFLQKGTWIGISGAGGILGQILTKWASFCELNVVAFVGNDDKMNHVNSLGARLTLNYNDKDIVQKSLEITKNYGLFAFYDTIGGDIFDKCKDTLSFFGKYVLVGTHGGECTMSVDKLRPKSLHFIAPSIGTYKALAFETIIGGMDFMHFLEQTKFNLNIEEFTLQQASQALLAVKNRKNDSGIIINFH